MKVSSARFFVLIVCVSMCPTGTGFMPGSMKFSDSTQASPKDTRGTKIFAVKLPSALSVKGLKAGATFPVSGALYQSLETFIARVVETHEKKNGSRGSLLVVSFDKVTFANNQEVHQRLRIQAIVSPSELRASPLIANPCDPVACSEKDGGEADAARTALEMESVCTENPKSKGQSRHACVPVSAASGIYGYPDYVFSAPNVAGRSDSAITSAKNNIRFEAGTYFILSERDFGGTSLPSSN